MKVALYVPKELENDEFEREAKRFAAFHGCEAIPFRPWHPEDVVAALLRAAYAPTIALLAIFCHGWRTRLQTGHVIGVKRAQQRVSDLAYTIATRLAPTGNVVLYACSTGTTPGMRQIDDVGGDGGFADALRDEIGKLGRGRSGHIDAHASFGHTTRRPYVRRYYIADDGEPSIGIGGDWLVAPGTARFKRFADALNGDLRFRFPLMSIEEVRAELDR